VSDLSRSRLRVVLIAMVGSLALAVGPGMTQVVFNTPGATPADPQGVLNRERGTGEEPYATREIQQRQMKRLREEHQHELFNDTDRLLQLANALKTEVDKGNDKGNKETLTADVMKRAEEIGKLAKRVSDRIKTQ
jgi:hypothetical protein